MVLSSCENKAYSNNIVCTDQFEARLRLGRLSSSRVAMARLLTLRFLMCISSSSSILLTCKQPIGGESGYNWPIRDECAPS